MRTPSPTSKSGHRFHFWLWDLSWVLGSPILALYLRDADIVFRSEWGVVGYYWLFSVCFSMGSFIAFRLHDRITPHFSVHDALDVIEALVFIELMTCIVLFALTRLDGIPRSMPLIHGLLLGTGLLAIRIFVRVIHSEDVEPPDYHSRRENIILIGANRFSSCFVKLLSAYAPHQQRVIAVLDENAATIGRSISGVRVLGSPHQLEAIISEFAIHGVGTERVVIAGEQDFLSHAALREVQRICAKRQIEFSFLPRMLGVTEWKPRNLEAMSSELAREPRFAAPSYFWLKRWIDIVGSLTLIVLFLPILIGASLLTLLDVGLPILFWQERVGRKGRPFLIYKFRTLKSPFDAAGIPTLGDRQPSTIGRVLRATRIDELPQLLNVLLGDMSLIGPRPLLPEDQPSNVNVRLNVRPGISGWAQVNGAKLVSKQEKGELDEWYIRNASLWLDLRIAIMTIRLLLKSHVDSEEALADSEQVRRPRRASPYRKPVQDVSASERPTSVVRTSRVPGLLTPTSTLIATDPVRSASRNIT